MNKRKAKLVKTPQDAISEAKRYFKNAKETLSKSSVEWAAYKDEKCVKEACGIGYLATLRAIDAYLLSKGTLPDKLPTSIQEYERELKKVPHNGKVMTSMRIVYENLHILGYYRGGVGTGMIKEGFRHAKTIIDTFITLSEDNKK